MKTKITKSNFDVIRERAKITTKAELARIYGTSYCTIYRVCKAKDFEDYQNGYRASFQKYKVQKKNKSEELKPIRGLHTDCSVASERVALIVAVSGNTEQPTAYRQITELLYGDQLDTVDKMDIAAQAIFKAMQAKLSLLERTK